MRSVFWAKLPHSSIQGTVWESAQDENAEIDVGRVVELFATKAPKSTTAAVPAASGATGPKPPAPPARAGGGGGGGATPTKRGGKSAPSRQASVLDSKRSRNCEITLRGLKLGICEIYLAVAGMDERLLNDERRQLLLAMLQSEDAAAEVAALQQAAESVKASDGDPDKRLARVDLFLLRLHGLPRLRQRLVSLRALQRLSSAVPALGTQIGEVSAAVSAFKTSGMLKLLFSHVLAIGNYVNGGTKRGGAWGLSLSSVAKLRAAKAVREDTSFLRAAAASAAKQFTDLENACTHRSDDDEGTLRGVAVQIAQERRALPAPVNESADLDLLCGVRQRLYFFRGLCSDMMAVVDVADGPQDVQAVLREATAAAEAVAAEAEAAPSLAESLTTGAKGAKPSHLLDPASEDVAAAAARSAADLKECSEEVAEALATLRQRAEAMQAAADELVTFMGGSPSDWEEALIKPMRQIHDEVARELQGAEKEEDRLERAIRGASKAAARAAKAKGKN